MFSSHSINRILHAPTAGYRTIIAAGAALLLAGPAFSAEPPADAAKPSVSPKTAEQAQSAEQSPRQQIRAIQGKLKNIEQAAVEANPELKEKRKELKSMVRSAMEENGHKPDEDIERLKEIQSQAQSGEIDKKQRQSLAKEFQQTRQRLAGARQEAMQDEDVKKARQELNEETLAAMKEQDPQTEELLQKMRQLSAQLRGAQKGAPQIKKAQ